MGGGDRVHGAMDSLSLHGGLYPLCRIEKYK